MKIFFIYPDIQSYALYKGTFYTGIGSLSASLKNNLDCAVKLIHLTKKISKASLISQIKSFLPDLVIFSSTTNMYPYVEEMAAWIKQADSKVKIICGGVHPTISPESVIGNANIDFVCIGEGEISLVELCLKINDEPSACRIEGIWAKDGQGKIYRNPVRPLIQDLDSLPFADRKIFNYPNLHLESEGIATVMLSRGCPFSCTYCCNDTLRNIYAKHSCKYVRFRSVESSIKELEQILSEYSFIKKIAFDDDILPLDINWFREFAAAYKNKIKLPYYCNLRPNLVTPETVNLLKDSGCEQVRMGIESGNDYIRNKVLGRNITKEQLVHAFQLCKNAGLKIYSYNMLGLPFENLNMMQETLRLNAELDTDNIQATVFYPYPGTPLYKICQDSNLLSNDLKSSDYIHKTILSFPLATRNQVVFIQRYFRILVSVYKFILKHPGRLSEIIELFLTKVLFSASASILVLPVFTKFFDIVWENRVIGNIARKINRAVFGR